MQKRIFALLLAAAMVLGLCACGQSVGGSAQDAAATTAPEAAGSNAAAAEAGSTTEPAAAGDVLKVGFVYIGDETEAYTANFIAAEKAIADTYGDKVECIPALREIIVVIYGSAHSSRCMICSRIFSRRSRRSRGAEYAIPQKTPRRPPAPAEYSLQRS